jgi:probable F420-dependent oxidoreductase
VKFGITLPNFGKSASKKSIDATASAAEEHGIDSLWTADHLLPTKEYANYGSALESLSTLAYVAGRTENILLGTAVIVFPMREVVLLARQAAAIQILSRNRLLLGLGAGWLEEEFKNVRANFQERGQYYDEGIQLFRWLMRGNAEFSGEYYNIENGIFGLVPKKEIPIYIGGNSGVSIRRAAKLGNGWFPIGVSPTQVRKGKEKLASLSHKKIEIVVRLNVVFAEKKGVLAKESKTSSGDTVTRLAGTPDEIAEQIAQYKRAGVGHLVCSLGDRERPILETKIKEFGDVISSA